MPANAEAVRRARYYTKTKCGLSVCGPGGELGRPRPDGIGGLTLIPAEEAITASSSFGVVVDNGREQDFT